MKKLLLLLAVVFALARCETHQENPEAERLAEIIIGKWEWDGFGHTEFFENQTGYRIQNDYSVRFRYRITNNYISFRWFVQQVNNYTIWQDYVFEIQSNNRITLRLADDHYTAWLLTRIE